MHWPDHRLHSAYFVNAAINTPLLKDLHNYITPNYAAHWRVIGALLGLSSGTLDIIKYDNHDKAESSCDAMLEKWLEVDPSASWENLLKVIESPAVSHDSSSDKQGKVEILCIPHYLSLS